jgi:hypothetical protein
MSDELQRRITEMPDSDLWHMVNTNPGDYREEALNIAREELRRRELDRADFEEIPDSNEGSVLPVAIDEVQYSENSYSGDLIITKKIIYYFPHTDWSKERRKRATIFGPVFGNLPVLFRGKNNPRLRDLGLWATDDSSEVLQSKLDPYIAGLKRDQKLEDFSSTLPLPLRFVSDEVKTVRLTMDGKLIIETSYDKHDFDIGHFQRDLLDEALRQSGFAFTHGA